MGYEVIAYFTDLKDFNHAYNVGDKFPRAGLKVTQARLDELSGSNNRQKKPLIRKIRQEVKYKKSDINRMPAAELREHARSVGVDDADMIAASELKKILIVKYNL